MSKLKTDIEQRVRYYLDRVGVGHWEATFTYGEYDDGYAGVEVLWFYEQARFHFDLGEIEKKMQSVSDGDAWLEELCAHEAVHCPLGPIAMAAEKLAEEKGDGVEEIISLLHELSTNILSRALILNG